MNAPLVYALVINWNGLEHLEACFDSLCNSSYPNLRLLLIDNASTDGSVDWVRERYAANPRVEILALPENRGWSGGNNAGIRYAQERGAAFLFLLNNDTWTAPDAVERLLEMALEYPKAGILAPKMVLFDAPQVINSAGLYCSIIGASWDRGIGRHDNGSWNTPVPVVGACGGALFMRSAVVTQAGLLPEEFGIYLDDLDLCLRALNAGFDIWTCPAAVVRHKFSATYGSGPQARRKYFLNTRNRFWLLLRHFPLLKAARWMPAVLLGEVRAVGRGLLSGEWWKLPAHLHAWAAAAAYLPRALHFRRHAPRKNRFWHFVLPRPYFCPAIELPAEGWYTERFCGGQKLRPMGAVAHLHVHRGRLRVIHANCYPAFGATKVHAVLNGAPLTTFSTTAVQEEVFEIEQGGELRLLSRHMFPAEATGEPIDIGGWFRFDVKKSKAPRQ